MQIIVIGAGIGGLACALACRQEGIDVIVLERAPEILPIGAGIQIPPNAARVALQLGILAQLKEKGTVLDGICFKRWANGKVLLQTPRTEDRYGAPWLVTHRADYHDVLLRACKKQGVNVCLGANVMRVDSSRGTVQLQCRETLQADVIVGADGLWSEMRELVLGHPSPPSDTGDLAYRGTFTKQQLEALGDAPVTKLCNEKQVTVWLGPDKHAVFYPVKQGREFNLVLAAPDDMPAEVRQIVADVGEMRKSFEGWDDTLSKIISCISTVAKWKLCWHGELETWVKNRVVLLGDACHPSLPYQAQGAAMAVEDGAVLGKLLGLASRYNGGTSPSLLSAHRVVVDTAELLALYESLRKSRTSVNVKGAMSNQHWYQLPDGPAQEARDNAVARVNWTDATEWIVTDPAYQQEMLGTDTVAQAEEAFAALVAGHGSGSARL